MTIKCLTVNIKNSDMLTDFTINIFGLKILRQNTVDNSDICLTMLNLLVP